MDDTLGQLLAWQGRPLCCPHLLMRFEPCTCGYGRRRPGLSYPCIGRSARSRMVSAACLAPGPSRPRVR